MTQVNARQQVGETAVRITEQQLRKLQRQSRRERLGRAWYKFSRNPLSVIGAATVLLVTLMA
ncbi:MAG: hypothetical protein JSV81_00300, partial [Anaerolineales bacterium]